MLLTLNIDGSDRDFDTPARTTLAKAIQDIRRDLFPQARCTSATCGACTVLADGVPVLSCIAPAAAFEGVRIETAASLANDPRLASLRNLFADPIIHPCGICAPGLLASAAALLDANPRPTREDVRHALAGHACLCIGYDAILHAVTAQAADTQTVSLPTPPPEPLPSRDEVGAALAQERGVARDGTVDPFARLRQQILAESKAPGRIADTFGRVQRPSALQQKQRQRAGSWVALQGTEQSGAVVFVELEVDAETDVVSLRRIAVAIPGDLAIRATITESGVMRGIFLALRPSADAAAAFFPSGFPTSIDAPEISHFKLENANAAVRATAVTRRDVSLATLRAIAGAIHAATGRFPDRAPFAPEWARMK